MAAPDVDHTEINRYYSIPQDFTNGKIFRGWLTGKTFDDQLKYGLEVWEHEMKRAGYDF